MPELLNAPSRGIFLDHNGTKGTTTYRKMDGLHFQFACRFPNVVFVVSL
jgi:hypothetical protein